ncbi:IPTL-CTERM sorting domain-containing protein [Comamonas sp. MYb21]|uniref:IPTL-CTERM sorting domain-containing protein n=1 Tax=Comamonas sp. MYb21 TaxID=1848648 RepID=UPI0030B3EFED
MTKKQYTSSALHTPLLSALLAGASLLGSLLPAGAQAQSVHFSGDASPLGDMGASHHASDVTVGHSGTSALAILAGGQLVSDSGMVSAQAGSTGTVRVEGAQSSWTVAGDLLLGQAGSATLQVRHGATVQSRQALESTALAGSSALIDVEGASSTLRGEECLFAGEGMSAVQIRDGGLLDCEVSALLYFGTLALRGAGSEWRVGTHLEIGSFAGLADTALTIGEGATVDVRDTLWLSSPAPGAAGRAELTVEGSIRPGALQVHTLVLGNADASVLTLDHSDASGQYQFGPDIYGSGQVQVNGSGTTVLTGNNSYQGSTRINAGLLRAGAANSLSPVSDFVVAAGATLDTSSYSPTVQSLDNSGRVTLAVGGTGSVLTVTQDYSGDGGVIEIHTALGADASPSAQLVVRGDTSGDSILHINNLGGAGAATTGDGIVVVQVDGASNGTFRLPAPGYVEAGGWRYTLAQVGKHWFLQSDHPAEVAGPAPSPVPTLGTLGLGAMATLMAAVGLRRRKTL